MPTIYAQAEPGDLARLVESEAARARGPLADVVAELVADLSKAYRDLPGELHLWTALCESGELDQVVLLGAEELAQERPRTLLEIVEGCPADLVIFDGLGRRLDLRVKVGRSRAQRLTEEVEEDRGRRAASATEARAQAKRQGDWVGITPYGWRVPEGESKYFLVREPEEADLVQEAATRVLDGDTLGSLVADWNRRGLRTRRGTSWRDTTVRRILTRSYLVGDGGEGQKVEPLVDRSTYRRLQDHLQKRKRANPGAPSDQAPPMLTGIIYCGLCGGPLKGRRRPSDTASYTCQTRQSSGASACAGTSLHQERAHEAVREELEGELRTGLLFETEGWVDAQRGLTREALGHAERLASQAVELGEPELADEAQAHVENLTHRQAFLVKLSGCLAEAHELWDPRRGLEVLDDAQVRAILSATLDRVTVDKVGQGVRVPARDRLRFQWHAKAPEVLKPLGPPGDHLD